MESRGQKKMNRDYIEGYMDGHSEGMAAGFNLMEKTKVSNKPEPREFWLFVSGEWAEAHGKDMPLHKSIRVREVIE